MTERDGIITEPTDNPDQVRVLGFTWGGERHDLPEPLVIHPDQQVSVAVDDDGTARAWITGQGESFEEDEG